MTIHVRLFAGLRDAVGAETCVVAWAPGARGCDVQAELSARYPQLAAWFPWTRLAVNYEYQPWDAVLHDGDEVAFIPPVSGG